MHSGRFLPLFLVIAVLAAVGCSHRQKVTTAPAAAPPAMAASQPAPEATRPPAAPEPAAAPAPDPLSGDLASVNAYLEKHGLLQDVYFDFDRASLSDQAREKLAQGSQFLRQHPQFRLTLEGNCDERGTAEYNLALGERRASSTRDYLKSLGVDSSRLQTLSYGKEKPVCTEEDETCWSQNRRVHSVVTGRSGG